MEESELGENPEEKSEPQKGTKKLSNSFWRFSEIVVLAVFIISLNRFLAPKRIKARVTIEKMVENARKKLPLQLADGLIATEVLFENDTILYKYQAHSLSRKEYLDSIDRDEMELELTLSVCTDKFQAEYVLANGFSVCYLYVDKDRVEAHRVSVTESDCTDDVREFRRLMDGNSSSKGPLTDS